MSVSFRRKIVKCSNNLLKKEFIHKLNLRQVLILIVFSVFLRFNSSITLPISPFSMTSKVVQRSWALTSTPFISRVQTASSSDLMLGDTLKRQTSVSICCQCFLNVHFLLQKDLSIFAGGKLKGKKDIKEVSREKKHSETTSINWGLSWILIKHNYSHN